MLLRPKTGLKDMVAELDAGHAGRRAGCTRAARSRSRQTLPDVNLDEILASLDADTRDYLQLLLSGGAEGAATATAASSRRRDPPLRADGARTARKVNDALAKRARRTSSASSTTSRC